MSDTPQTHPPGWYYAQGDPPGTQRYWDGSVWQGGPQPVPGASPAGVPDALHGALADPLKRVAARLIDLVVWVLIGNVLPALIGLGFFGTRVSNIVLELIVRAVFIALVVAYEVLMIGTQGATVGKMLLGLKVVNDDGSPADYMTGLMRMAIYIVVGMLMVFPVLGLVLFAVLTVMGFVMLFVDAKQQTPWDKVGRTLVVER